MASARVLICCSPNMSFRSEKTRSHDAEFGEMAKTMRAASAHDLKLPQFVRHHVRMPSVYAATSALSKVGALTAAER